ncbi:S-layer homology domain-containing protein [Aeromicrobium alkaliterrae]|uniref:SLH domain-containing protein n=1 Tax=Aeromicrobium alkaliterrae TaxID=302168 RepID=A0ABN2JF94_9ACTN
MSVVRRTVAVVAAIAAVLVAPAGAQAAFTDVPPGHVFAAEIDWLAEQGITTGYSVPGGTEFRPSAPVLREQMAAFLYRYANATETETSCGLLDVPPSHTFAKEICWLKSTGITTGYAVPGGTEFRGGQPVLREQMAAFLARLAEVEGSLTTPATAPFLDVPTTHTFAKQIAWLATTGVTKGYAVPGGTEFRGAQPVLREQMAAFLARYDGFVGWTVDSSTAIASNLNFSGANQSVLTPSTSADGRYVVFSSPATNLVAGDSNGNYDVFWRDMTTGETRLVSRAATATGVIGNGASFSPDVSDDGRYVTFESSSNNLVPGDTNATGDVFLRNMVTNAISVESVSSSETVANGPSTQARISANGRFITFVSYAVNLVAVDSYDGADVFVRDTQGGGLTERVGLGPNGTSPNQTAMFPSISSDGKLVAFQSSATNIVAGNSDGRPDVYRWNRDTNVTTLVSPDPFGNGGSSAAKSPRISDDGDSIAFHAEDLTTGPTPRSDVFVWSRSTGATTKISSSPTGAAANGSSVEPSISADGRYVSFGSSASNLVVGDTNAKADVFFHDRRTRITTLVSKSGGTGAGNADSSAAAVSADGTRVAFLSAATNFVLIGTNNVTQAYVWRRDSDG